MCRSTLRKISMTVVNDSLNSENHPDPNTGLALEVETQQGSFIPDSSNPDDYQDDLGRKSGIPASIDYYDRACSYTIMSVVFSALSFVHWLLPGSPFVFLLPFAFMYSYVIAVNAKKALNAGKKYRYFAVIRVLGLAPFVSLIGALFLIGSWQSHSSTPGLGTITIVLTLIFISPVIIVALVIGRNMAQKIRAEEDHVSASVENNVETPPSFMERLLPIILIVPPIVIVVLYLLVCIFGGYLHK